MGGRIGGGWAIRLLGVIVVSTVLASVVAGCGGGSSTGATQTSAGDARLAQGRALFRQICAGCHRLADAGASGYREPLDHSNLSESTQRHELAVFVIEHGDSIMPEWERGLTKREIAVLADYLTQVVGRTRSGDGRRSTTLTPRPDPWVTRPPAERFADGNALFREMCAGCHTLAAAGAHGERVNLDAALAPVPDRAAVVRHALKYSDAMPDWTRRLNAAEIDALVRYVSTVAGRER